LDISFAQAWSGLSKIIWKLAICLTAF